MLNLKFSQIFGPPAGSDVKVEDVVSSLVFDSTGIYFAVGDQGGRVVVFKQIDSGKSKKNPEYELWVEFQSHEPQVDYLKSIEISEKINQIRWLTRRNPSHFLLTANDKTIKLWKISEKRTHKVVSNLYNEGQDVGTENAPRSNIVTETTTATTPRRIYSEAHTFHINSISLNSDDETFLSADDLRINLWNFEFANQSYNIVDLKPTNFDDLSEVITCASFHPSHCNVFAYGSSKGCIRVADSRQATLCNSLAKLFWEKDDEKNRSYFSEFISSISDVKFSKDGRYLLSRDYLTLKLWDLNKENKPIKKFNIHDDLRSKFCELYENDCIFDKFECGFGAQGNYMYTGSYNNYFFIYDTKTDDNLKLQVNKFMKPKPKSYVFNKGKGTLPSLNLGHSPPRNLNPNNDLGIIGEELEFNKKIQHIAWHPHEHVIAIGALSNLYIYTT